MKDVLVKIKSIKVINVSVRDCQVELEILFNNYKTIKSLVIDNPPLIAHNLLSEIRRKMKEQNPRFDGEHILDTILTINIQNEEETEKRIAMFLSKLADKVNTIKKTTMAQNYMSMINSIKSMKLEL